MSDTWVISPYVSIIVVLMFSVSTLRSALELKSIFDRLQEAERSGQLSPEALRKLEEQAAEQGIRTLWKVSHQCNDSSRNLLMCRAPSLKLKALSETPPSSSSQIHLYLQRSATSASSLWASWQRFVHLTIPETSHD